uniref:Uncharacterized protein n=1 Tax=Ananas comosus var. bracteatus TaxID=296719 RepID=A0A6V7Q3M6_ANACO|nr:unnamed protein product [Ananas comosus var. bracteatus]
MGSSACAVSNDPVVVNTPTLGMSLPYGIPFCAQSRTGERASRWLSLECRLVGSDPHKYVRMSTMAKEGSSTLAGFLCGLKLLERELGELWIPSLAQTKGYEESRRMFTLAYHCAHLHMLVRVTPTSRHSGDSHRDISSPVRDWTPKWDAVGEAHS